LLLAWLLTGRSVVYSEMQGVQNNQGELMDLQARRLLYPKNVGFRYETGGHLEQLRELTAERIRSFHGEMYQPRNLCLILTGQVNHTDLIEILDKFEDGILHDVPDKSTPWKRPWVDSPRAPPLDKSCIKTIEFPEEDESSGEILIGFFGPDTNDALQGM
jgi:Zn-dependent M16 (insulinase) family peptidase